MVDGAEAARNFTRIASAGGRGLYGWYEALDYTPVRIPEGEKVAIVRAYMAHHQGMTLVALADTLGSGAMRTRFHAEPIIQATELLLQERIPREVAIAYPSVDEAAVVGNGRRLAVPIIRRFHSPHDPIPRTQLLSNGNYAVMLTAAGSGIAAGRTWRSRGGGKTSRAMRPGVTFSCATCRAARYGLPDISRAARSRTVTRSHFPRTVPEIVRRDGPLTTTLEVVVSPEENAEVRRVSIANHDIRTRTIELTSYAEVVLAPPASDAAHPAFSKLSVETEFVADVGTLLATRRLRSPGEIPVWAAHLAVVEGDQIGDLQCDTDRAGFLGQGRTLRKPAGIMEGGSLSDTVGDVLDPIFSLRVRVRILPGATARVAFWTLVAASRTEALDLADKHHDASAFERAATLAWTQAQAQLMHLGIRPEEAHLFQRLANHVLYSDPTLRPSSEILKRSEDSQSKLWAYGISGDLPIVLVQTAEAEDVEIVRQLVRAHEYWQMKQLAVDLVIINESPTSYVSDLHGALQTMVRSNQSRIAPAGEGARGSVFVLSAALVTGEARDLLQSTARAVLVSRHGSLSARLERMEEACKLIKQAKTVRPASSANGALPPAAPRLALEFFNGLGGFAADGREYVTVLGEGQSTPLRGLT